MSLLTMGMGDNSRMESFTFKVKTQKKYFNIDFKKIKFKLKEL